MDDELQWHGIAPDDGFPAMVLNAVQGSIESHSHAFYEIVYVEDGFCLHFADEEVGLLMAGDLIALLPGQKHYYRCRNNVKIYNILFLTEALDGVLGEIRTLPGMEDFFNNKCDSLLHNHLSLPDRERVQTLIRDMRVERENKPPGWQVRSKALLIDFMVLVSRVFGARFPQPQSTNPYLGYVISAISLMEEKYNSAITVSGIAASLGISPDHFTRQFRQITGITPIECLKRYRFARALELLREQHPVSDVSREIGFRHVNYFSREFKALFNMTPTDFQKQLRERF